MEDSKDWKGNSVTAIDVHPQRHEYVASGHLKGQIALLDLTKLSQSPSPLKVIKSHKTAIVSVKFC
jgi:hypothetical protein